MIAIRQFVGVGVFPLWRESVEQWHLLHSTPGEAAAYAGGYLLHQVIMYEEGIAVSVELGHGVTAPSTR